MDTSTHQLSYSTYGTANIVIEQTAHMQPKITKLAEAINNHAPQLNRVLELSLYWFYFNTPNLLAAHAI